MNASRQSLYDRFPNHRENVDIPNKCFNKFVTWETPESDTASFVKAVSPWFTYINRGGGFGEFCMHAYSKATGIQFLADRFGLSLDDCYVIGDSMNDLPMLDYVQHSILMGNGTPSLRSHVEYVTLIFSMTELKMHWYTTILSHDKSPEAKTSGLIF